MGVTREKGRGKKGRELRKMYNVIKRIKIKKLKSWPLK